MDENDFPDADEEYDLIPTKIYGTLDNVSTVSKNNEEIEEISSVPSLGSVNNTQVLNGNSLNDDEFPNPNEELEFIEADVNQISNTTCSSNEAEKNKKRTFDELFGDIKDLLDEDIPVQFNENRNGKRPRWDEPHKIIETIRLERKKILEKYEIETSNNNPIPLRPKMGTVSLRVPTWNFVAITRITDCQRLYVKVRPESKVNTRKFIPTSGLLSVRYNQLKEEAEKIILENTKRASLPIATSNTEGVNSSDELWVDKYRPKTYMDLLSDETVNRDFLRWMKLWDKVVFHRELKPRKKDLSMKPSFDKRKFGTKKANFSPFNAKNFTPKVLDFDTVDKRGFPTYRIALICGPPGLGKTTLAHIVAKHAGYNVVDINASDDRGSDSFRQALLASTQMKSMLGSDPRPNCLVLDEIDGAPASSIDLLLKFVQGKLHQRGKKSKDAPDKSSEYCKRPIVCICNEAYTPSLRPLRVMAYMVNVSKVNPTNLADRLMIIARKENIRVSQNTLLQLAERSGCDIRLCLGTLQFMGKNFGSMNENLGIKDTRKGLFDSWRQILQVPMKRNGPLPIQERVQLILNSAYTDSSERLSVGIFENYLQNCHDKMDQISKSLEWFQFYDEVVTTVMTKNDWRVMPYTNFAFVSWHLGFAGPKNPKLSFPQAPIDAQQKLNKNMAIVKSAQKSSGRDAQIIILDLAPCVFEILNPRLRAVPINLYSSKEKIELKQLISVMLDLGLSFIQDKNEDGSVDYYIDPNLFEIGIFPDCKVRRGLFYTTKQIVSQELEIERLKRAAMVTGIGVENSKNDENNKNIKQVQLSDLAEKNIHLNSVNKLIPSKVHDKKIRDFFQNFKVVPKQQEPLTKIECTEEKRKQTLNEHGVWFKYNEGYSNAIRRKVKINDLL